MTGAYDATGAGLDLSQIERRARELLATGQVFLAYDLVQDGLERFPDVVDLRILKALALCQTGAAGPARAIVEPIVAELDFDLSEMVANAVSALRTLVSDQSKPKSAEETEDLLQQLSQALSVLRDPAATKQTANAETLQGLADVYVALFQMSLDQKDLINAGHFIERCHELQPSLRRAFGVATSSAILGETEKAKEFALETKRFFEELSAPVYADYAMTGIAQLLLGDTGGACRTLTKGQDLLGGPSEEAVIFLRVLAELERCGRYRVEALAPCLKPPRIAVFAGHALDRPDADEICLPKELEADLRRAIDVQLDQMDITIGYSLPRAGSDLLFIEALLEREAEVHVILPYNLDDFIAHGVAYGGRKWEKRFQKALRLAESISYATVERFMGHEALNRFANQYLHGLALLRSSFLQTDPFLLAVWDMRAGSLPGGAADFIDQWEDISRLRIIDLDMLREDAGIEVEYAPTPPALEGLAPAEREIRTMLFADIVGFSKLEDDAIPDFLAFYEALFKALKADAPRAITINTWGDAFFVVMEDATVMVEFALAMLKAFHEVRSQFGPLIAALDLRTSLHAGPVFPGYDPFRKDRNFYGAHINRAARLEPVTIPGQIFATQQFVALLTVEEAARRHELGMTGEDYVETVSCDYVGIVDLAKGFGRQSVYHIRRK